MKPKRTADLSLFLTVTGLLLGSVSSLAVAQKNRAIVSHDSTDHEFLPITQNPDFILPMDDPEDDSNYDYGTQAALNGLAGEYSRKVDSMLNTVYKAILSKYSVDTEFIRYFKRAEAAWIIYRDAEMLAIIPPIEPPDVHGSMESMCYSEYRVSLTRERISELLMWLNVDPMNQTGCDTFYPDDLLQSMRGQKNQRKE